MIENLTIRFAHNGLNYRITVLTDGENTPYDLASAFGEVIEKCNADPHIVIEELMERFGKGDGK